MKRILLTLTALASLSLANARAVDDKTFFSGAHLGMTIEECDAYYFPDGVIPGAIGAPALGSIPIGAGATATTRTIADAGSVTHSGAPKGEKEVDYRTNSNPAGQRRVLIDYRKSDHKIVYVSYWKVDDGNEKSFSKEEIRYLTALNSGQGPLITNVDDDGEFTVTTEAQYKVEHPKTLTAVSAKVFFSGVYLGMPIDEAIAYYDQLAESSTSNSGFPPDETYIDFHTLSNPEWFVMIYYRTSDRKIVYVLYWKMGKNEIFSPEEMHYLTGLSSGTGNLFTQLQAFGAQFIVTTKAQYKLQYPNE